MNYVFFKCLGTGDYHVHVFSTPEEACDYLKISRRNCSYWRSHIHAYGPSVYKELYKGYALAFLDPGTEEEFFDQFSEACAKLVVKLVRIVRPFICAERGESFYTSLTLKQEPKEKARVLIDWINNNILAPRTLLLSRGFSMEELFWLQAYAGIKVLRSMEGISKLNF